MSDTPLMRVPTPGEDERSHPPAPDRRLGGTKPRQLSSASDAVVMGSTSAVRQLVPVDRLDSWITDIADVYVIAHMGIPQIDRERWRLTVEGLVEHVLTLDYNELISLPSCEATAVIECFGNPVEPDVPTRRVGNVAWRGVPLSDVLAVAKVQPGADAVWLEGLDSGTFAGVPNDRYLKDLPLDRVLEGDVLLAWQMNGAPLTLEHGFPVRAFVPGYFGTNAVKWLSRIQVASGRPKGLFTTQLYNRQVVVDGAIEHRPVRELDVNSIIVRPKNSSILAPGRHMISGWAWSAWNIARVDVSTDAGVTWTEAQTEPSEHAHAWQRFMLDWLVEESGEYQLACRALDTRGRTQPFQGRNRVHIVNVTVT
jgi:sulfane dehydrogenase subunit SoxC